MEKNNIFEKLFIFEIANNHMGDLKHGIRIIKEISKVAKDFNFKFAFKLQYRDLDTFIHPSFKGRKDIKYIKRFEETRLSKEELKILKDEIKKVGFIAICTPFDENALNWAEDHDFDIIKIASCSFGDWPLLERIAKTNKPIIASTAGVKLEDIDKVVMFFEHREKKFALMHCVGEYPTLQEHLQLNQIDVLKRRYPNVPIGYSTHEDPNNFDAIKIAIAKGAVLFEKHVGIPTEKYKLNAYSATPQQIYKWLKSAQDAFLMCGETSRKFSEKELKDLRGLKRGVYAKVKIKKGEKLNNDNVFFAIPNFDNQILANDMSKYMEFTAKKDIEKNEPIFFNDVEVKNLRQRVLEIVKKIRKLLIESKIFLPNRVELEISHHYGIENFEKYGAVLINCINREYCKKLIIVLPGQMHPVHYHIKKEETFNVLYGNLIININGEEKEYKPGDIVTIERGVRHSFRSPTGAIFEEISTTSFPEDSYYDDERIRENKSRKTHMTFWQDWLFKPVS